MFNEPNTPDSPQHEDTHIYTTVHTYTCTYTYTAAVGPAGLRLLAADMESPDADSYRNKHGLSIHLHIYSWNNFI